VPRTQKKKKRAIRFCGDCGYPLEPDDDGTCPMCPRFQQLRMDFTVPRPSDLHARRSPVSGEDMTAAPGEWPPTVAEYRAILAGRRTAPSASPSRGRVIEKPELRQIRVPAPPIDPGRANVDALGPPVSPGGQGASPSKKIGPKRRKGKRGTHAARADAPRLASEEHKLDQALMTSAAPADAPMTYDSAAVTEDLEAQGAPAQSAGTLRHTPRSSMDPSPVPPSSRWRVEALRRWLVTMGVVAASALFALMVATFLSSP
jgi:hypothetical protein